jgi:dihydroflavonol-4-reductase
MTRVFVTGANGHIGSNTVRSLLRRGYEVVPFVRPGADLRGIEKLGLTCRLGDVRDYASLLKAAQGCDVIIHHATVFRLWAKDQTDILKPALEGTRNIFKAARETGARRMIYTSSMAAVGYLRKPDGLRTEADWNDHAQSPYFIAKTHSEREALRLANEYQIPTIRLCPTQVNGPLDYRITPSTKEIMDFINKRTPTYVGGSNFVHVYDVGEAHALAIEHGEPGSRYIVCGDNLHLKEVCVLITKLTGVKPNHLGITGPIIETVGALAGFVSKFTGVEPLFDRQIVQDVVGWYGFFDCSAANQTFWMTPHGAEETLRDTIRWLLFLGKIKPGVAERIAAEFPPDPDW